MSLQLLSFTLKERWVKAVFVCFHGADTLSSSSSSLHLAWRRLWHPHRGSAWKQTAAAAPVSGPDRCAARCRVARRLEYRCMADRYHNHTSPLLSLTYWIKHLPSCSRIAHPSSPPKSGGKGTSGSVFGMSEVTWERCTMIPNKWGPQSCFYLSHLQIDLPDTWQGFVPGCCSCEGVIKS